MRAEGRGGGSESRGENKFEYVYNIHPTEDDQPHHAIGGHPHTLARHLIHRFSQVRPASPDHNSILEICTQDQTWNALH